MAPKNTKSVKKEDIVTSTSGKGTNVEIKNDEVTKHSLFITLFKKGEAGIEKATQWASIITQADEAMSPDDFCKLYIDSQYGTEESEDTFDVILKEEFGLDKQYDRVMIMGTIRRFLGKKKNTGKWSYEELDLLEEGINKYGEKWYKIAELIKTRDVGQVKRRVRELKVSKEEEEDLVNGLEQTHISTQTGSSN